MIEQAHARRVLHSFGFPDELADGTARLADLRARDPIGFCLFVLAFEDPLASPFPDGLLDVLVTVDDLVHFAQVKAGQER